MLPDARIGPMTCINLKPGQATDAGLAAVKAGGWGMFRHGLYWRQVEAVKGTYDWTAADALFPGAAAKGLWVLCVLYGSNPLYEDNGTVGIETEAGRVGFANFAAAAAERYRTNVIWEIWNEPNLQSFWHAPSNTDLIADEYTALVKVVAPAMKVAAPDAEIVAGSISALWSLSFKWFDRCVSQGLLSSGITGVSVHPYGFRHPEQSAGGYQVIKDKITAAGSMLYIINSEVGFSLGWIERDGVSVTAAPTVQGWMLIRQQLIDLMCGVRASNWYEWKAGPEWAVVKPDLTPLPAYAAARRMTKALGGYAFVNRIPTASPDDYALLLQNAAGAQKIAKWSKSGPTHSATIAINGVDTALSFGRQPTYMTVN